MRYYDGMLGVYCNIVKGLVESIGGESCQTHGSSRLVKSRVCVPGVILGFVEPEKVKEDRGQCSTILRCVPILGLQGRKRCFTTL